MPICVMYRNLRYAQHDFFFNKKKVEVCLKLFLINFIVFIVINAFMLIFEIFFCVYLLKTSFFFVVVRLYILVIKIIMIVILFQNYLKK